MRVMDRLRRLGSYGLVSVAMVVLGQALLAGLHGLAGWSPAAASLGSAAVGTVVAFVLYRRYVWRGLGAGDLARTVRLFALLNVVGVVVSTIAVSYAGHLAANAASPGIVRMLAVNITSIGSYAGIWVARFLLIERLTAASSVEGLIPSS